VLHREMPPSSIAQSSLESNFSPRDNQVFLLPPANPYIHEVKHIFFFFAIVRVDSGMTSGCPHTACALQKLLPTRASPNPASSLLEKSVAVEGR
jgi:hypothetical protein